MPEDRDAILETARRVVESALVGIMSSVDEQSQPHGRYMAAVMHDEGLGRLYSLTGTATQKVHDIRQNPRVGWLFADEDFHHVVTLTGRAEFLNTSDLPESVWDHLIEYAEPYAVTQQVREQAHADFTAIVTAVEAVGYLCPDEGIVRPMHIEL